MLSVNELSMKSMAGMTMARLGVSREKNSVASLRICVTCDSVSHHVKQMEAHL